jgi:hypothetical protein
MRRAQMRGVSGSGLGVKRRIVSLILSMAASAAALSLGAALSYSYCRMPSFVYGGKSL